jgi:hypothetical protein
MSKLIVAAAVSVALAAHARVLTAYQGLEPDDVIEGDPALLASLADQGVVDLHPDAVAYALGLGGEVIPFPTPDTPAPDAE